MANYDISSVNADGIKVFYRHAGIDTSPVILLLHGFPSSSHQFRNLIPLLAIDYRVIAPDFPGFGFTEVPGERKYQYSFANIAKTIEAFVEQLELSKFAIYIFDYGAPKYGNAYEEGLGSSWAPIQKYWSSDAQEDRDALRAFLTLDGTKSQYLDGSPHPEKIEPESYYLDQTLMDRPGNKDIQLDLFYDYRTNVELYPDFHRFFRNSGIPVLAVWGSNDGFFIPSGAKAFARDVKHFELHFLDASHFALETNEKVIAQYIISFFERNNVFQI